MPNRVAVIGNCQAAPIAGILSQMNPGLKIKAFPYTRFRDDDAITKAVSQLESYDLVLTQNIERPLYGLLSPSQIKAWHSNVVDFPAIIFNGFHPDFVLSNNLRFVSAASNCHSLIVAACFIEGVPIDDVRSVFNPFTFKILGYFEAFEKAKTYLLAKALEAGYDLTEEFEGWRATGRFMYTTNHPTVPVLLSIAQAAARKTGLAVTPMNETEIDDGLARQQILPVYPPVAKRLGVSGGYQFGARAVHKERDAYGIMEYIIRTYELYQQAPKAGFQNRAIQRTIEVLHDRLPRSNALSHIEAAASN